MVNRRLSGLLIAVVFAFCTSTSHPVTASDDITVVAVGDIAQQRGHQAETAALTDRINPNNVLLLGDLAYYQGSTQQFRDYFLPNWEKFGSRIYAVPGNHEYGTKNAAGYRAIAQQFSWPRLRTGALWWHRNLKGSNWALIGLNSEIVSAKGIKLQSAFLRSALQQHQGQPTVVMWHRPRFSVGLHGDNKNVDALWKLVASDSDVKLVLWGHDHNYEHRKYIYRNSNGSKRYLDTFVVGTGGAELRQCRVPSRPPSLLCGQNNFGVLKLTLQFSAFEWEFVHVNDAVADTGTRSVE